MPRYRDSEPVNIANLLNHIRSLGVVSANNMRPTAIKRLLELGFIRQVWIGNYALTEEGERARKQPHSALPHAAQGVPGDDAG